MELNKRTFKGKYKTEFYCKKNEVVDEDNYVLLGFKDNLPVLSNPEPTKNTKEMHMKKTLKVEVDAQTGEKFLNLNGKKLKMIKESELPPHLKPNIQTFKPNILNKTSPNPLKIKIIGGLPSILNGPVKVDKSPELQNADKIIFKPNVNKTYSKVDKSNVLSSKTMLIGENKLATFISSVDSASKAYGTPFGEKPAVKQENGKLNGGIAQLKLEFQRELKPYKPLNNMKALDLSKVDNLKMKKTFDDKCVQTDEKITCTRTAQTDEYFNFNLLDLIGPDIFDEPISFPSTPNYPGPANMIGKSMDAPQKQMLQNRADLFFKDLRSALMPDDLGNMPIHVGVLTNNLNLIKKNCNLLRALRKNVDIPNHGDVTALQLAVINGANTEIIKLLLKNGASLDVTDTEGNNIVHLVVEYERQDFLEIILEEAVNFDLDQFNAEGYTPLMICCCKKLMRCAELLIKYGADINLKDRKSGRTPLFHAAENHHFEMVELLLRHNANTKIKNFFGTSPHDAMYEIEEIPAMIKTAILMKSSKRRFNDEPKRKLAKTKRPVYAKPLKTYAKLRKILDPNFQDEIEDSPI